MQGFESNHHRCIGENYYSKRTRRDTDEVRTRLVACFDFLGFKELVENTPLSSLAEKHDRIVHQLTRIDVQVAEIHIADKTAKTIQRTVPHVLFSDSLFLWADTDPYSSTAFIQACCNVMCTSVKSKLPLRGGIALGEVVMRPSKSIYVGKELWTLTSQNPQDWVGVAIHPSAMEGPVGNHMRIFESVTKYPIPTKTLGIPLTHTLTWHHYAHPDDIDDALNELKSLAPQNVKLKYDNTLDFISKTKIA